MKFSWKIFFVSFLITVVAFGAGGFALVNAVFSSSLNARLDAARDSNRYATSAFCASFSNLDAAHITDTYAERMARIFSSQLSSADSNTMVVIGTKSSVRDYGDTGFANNLRLNCRAWRTASDNGKSYFQVVSKVQIGLSYYYVQTVSDLTDLYQSRAHSIYLYQLILLLVAFGASVVLFIVSRFLTRPLVKLSEAAGEIAKGDFSKRAADSSTREMHELSQSFNTMAESVESYVQSRDDFVADFTHELKTPLTSVIGYADMLRSYELDAKQRRKCADAIFREGKRLEALSANLLDLIVMQNSDFSFSELETEVLFAETGSTVEFLLRKYSVRLDIDFESAILSCEPSLLRTLIYNLIDNAGKACNKGQKIKLTGRIAGDCYGVTVIDNGCGMSEDDLQKITRPFYMVDKSRSRSMGGAGLGLALCERIASLHGSSLHFVSTRGVGTRVSFTVPLSDREEDMREE